MSGLRRDPETGEHVMLMVGGPRHGRWAPWRAEGSQVTVPVVVGVKAGMANDLLAIATGKVAVEIGEVVYTSHRVAIGDRWVPVWLCDETLKDRLGVEGLLMDLMVLEVGGQVDERGRWERSLREGLEVHRDY